MTVDVAWAIDWTRRSAAVIRENRDELIELDRQIGDGDHGENLNRGFSAVVAKLDALEEQPADVGEVLKLVATTLMSTVGGAAVPRPVGSSASVIATRKPGSTSNPSNCCGVSIPAALVKAC